MSSGGSGSRRKGKNVFIAEPEVEEQDYDRDFDDVEQAYYGDDVDLEHISNFPTQESLPTSDYSTAMGTEETGAGRATKSNIWEHFTKVERPDLGPKRYEVLCKHCPNPKPYQYIGGQGYGTFHRHLDQKHKDIMGIDKRQQKISRYGTNAPPFHFDQKNYREQFARFISVEHLPFGFAESFGTVNFLQSGVNPEATPISRSTVTRDLGEIYKSDKKELRLLFKNLKGYVHIGSDVWSDHWQNYSYMGITCHWIDDDWNIQKRVLAFRLFGDPHTASNICAMIRDILDEYHLINKVFSIGFDNASSNTASIPELKAICQPSFGGKFFHIRCVCHVLNLCVQDGMRILNEQLEPIKSAVQFLWRNPKKMKEWDAYCLLHKGKKKQFPKDVPTRWNSTYKLLVETYTHKELLCAFMSKYLPHLQLWTVKWEICAKILDILKVFHDSTNALSGVYYPTSHLFIIEALNIAGLFENLDVTNTLDPISVTLVAIRQKWINYYYDIPMIYLVACVFYPRCKLEGLGICLNSYYNDLNIATDIPFRQNEVKEMIVEIYNEFVAKYKIGGDSSTSSHNMPSSESHQNRGKGYQFLFNRRKKQKEGSISELDSYLTISFEVDDKNFAILDWWKNHEIQFPILSLIAKQILATPCSTVAVEQLFSTGGNILDVRRSRLTPRNLERQVCVEDWTKAKFRQQELDRRDDEFFDDGATTSTVNTEAEGGGDSDD